MPKQNQYLYMSYKIARGWVPIGGLNDPASPDESRQPLQNRVEEGRAVKFSEIIYKVFLALATSNHFLTPFLSITRPRHFTRLASVFDS